MSTPELVTPVGSAAPAPPLPEQPGMEDPGEDLLRTGAGSALAPLVRRGQLRISRIEGPNHAFTPVWTRDVLTDVLESELDVR